jgi:hypothetical protein
MKIVERTEKDYASLLREPFVRPSAWVNFQPRDFPDELPIMIGFTNIIKDEDETKFLIPWVEMYLNYGFTGELYRAKREDVAIWYVNRARHRYALLKDFGETELKMRPFVEFSWDAWPTIFPYPCKPKRAVDAETGRVETLHPDSKPVRPKRSLRHKPNLTIID